MDTASTDAVNRHVNPAITAITRKWIVDCLIFAPFMPGSRSTSNARRVAHTRSHPRRRRDCLQQPLPPTGLARSLTCRSFLHQWRGSSTDKVLEKRTFLWILGDRRPVEPTQSRKGAETQRFWLVSTITRRVNHLNLSFPWYLPVLCVLAAWRLCVNCRSEERRVGKECRSRWSP